MLTTDDVDIMLDDCETAIAICTLNVQDHPALAPSARLWAASFRSRKSSLTRLRRRVMVRTFNPMATKEPIHA